MIELLPATNFDFLAVADWRSTIEIVEMLHPASAICLWADFSARNRQLGGHKKTETVDRTNSIYHANTPEMRTVELVVNRELLI